MVSIQCWVTWSTHSDLKRGVCETGRSYVEAVAESEPAALTLAAQIAGCKDEATVDDEGQEVIERVVVTDVFMEV